MTGRYQDRTSRGVFTVSIGDSPFSGHGFRDEDRETIYSILWNMGEAQEISVDNICYLMPANSMVALAANQHVVFTRPEDLVAWQFNREFYCITDHAEAAGCPEFPFYGIGQPLFVLLSKEGHRELSAVCLFCLEEMGLPDRLQGEMLRTILKQMIIKVVRRAIVQLDSHGRTPVGPEIVRKFNLLLEEHFRVHHEVSFYAAALNKSPKTLTNIFGLHHCPSPLKLIQRRIILEAKRYLYFTDKSAKEVASELGFANAAHFSRFFKMGTGVNFSEFVTEGAG